LFEEQNEITWTAEVQRVPITICYYPYPLSANLMILICHRLNRQLKDKAISLQAWTGPEGSRSVRLPDF